MSDTAKPNLAFTFPGQGSQVVGMGKALAQAFPTARDVFQEVDEALSQNLSQLMFDGTQEELTLTQNAQPALMAVSMAVMRVLTVDGGFHLPSKVRYVAGHSLGEYSALASASTLTLADTARLLRIRGLAMQAAVPVGVGAMAALLGLDYAQAVAVAAAAAQGEVCEAANDNGGGQVVVSGHKGAVERALELAKAAGAKRAILLPVSAPFHCSLMQTAAQAMQDALAKVDLKAPSVPLVANVLAAPVSNPQAIRAHLVAQVTGTVRWRESIAFMANEGQITQFMEVGTGKVLSGLVKRISDGAIGTPLGTPEEIEAFLKLHV